MLNHNYALPSVRMFARNLCSNPRKKSKLSQRPDYCDKQGLPVAELLVNNEMRQRPWEASGAGAKDVGVAPEPVPKCGKVVRAKEQAWCTVCTWFPCIKCGGCPADCDATPTMRWLPACVKVCECLPSLCAHDRTAFSNTPRAVHGHDPECMCRACTTWDGAWVSNIRCNTCGKCLCATVACYRFAANNPGWPRWS